MLVSLIFSKKFIFAPKLAKIENEKNDEKYSKKKNRKNATNLHYLAIFTKKNCKKYLNEKSCENTTKYRKMFLNKVI